MQSQRSVRVPGTGPVGSLEMQSGRSKKEYAMEAQAVADAPDGPTPIATNGASSEAPEAVVAIWVVG